MYNNNSYQNNKPADNVNVNTNYLYDYSDTAKLTVTGWNDKLSLKITRANGKNAQGITTYNDNDVFNTALTKDAQIALLDGIENVIMPALNNFVKPVSVGVQTGNNDAGKVINLEVNKGQFGPQITLAAYATMQGGQGVVYAHEFRNRTYYTDYNPMTRSGNEIQVPTKFLQFVDILKRNGETVPIGKHIERYQQKMSEAYRNSQSPQNGNQLSGLMNGYSSATGSYSADGFDALPFS